jgi:hypothetical protein
MPHTFIPLDFERLPLEESRARVERFRDLVRRRRSVRDYYVQESVGIAAARHPEEDTR